MKETIALYYETNVDHVSRTDTSDDAISHDAAVVVIVIIAAAATVACLTITK